ncbi:MAG: hypothetical protein PHH54_03765 [Candidatus Nanoarchaeia archaeon]|nr:hypothetical protein [Candidatus Nanoarchaeia archaeon]MDD5741076.1 hypothetical protein [Candidatus Nanoarchaeia archaeon]
MTKKVLKLENVTEEEFNALKEEIEDEKIDTEIPERNYDDIVGTAAIVHIGYNSKTKEIRFFVQNKKGKWDYIENWEDYEYYDSEAESIFDDCREFIGNYSEIKAKRKKHSEEINEFDILKDF